MKCSVENCDREIRYAGMCGMHYKRKWRHGNPMKSYTPTRGQVKALCSVLGCDKIVNSKGMCSTHYLRFSRYGRLHTIVNRGSGWSMNSAGYIVIQIEPYKTQYEHILLAEKALGRKLPSGAVVHHTGDPWDNYGFCKLVICPNQAYHLLLHRRMKNEDL